MAYDRIAIYYFSGTGNTRRVATWMEKPARKSKAKTQVWPIADARPETDLAPGPGTLLGVMGPTHAFTSPWTVVRFILGLPRGGGAHAFVAATRASFKVGPLATPGMAGTAIWLPVLLLFLKGYRVRGARSFDMPSNWMALHPSQKAKQLEAIVMRSKAKVKAFVDPLLDGRTSWWAFNNLYELFWGLLLLPLSLAYLLIGRRFLTKLFFADHECNHCGLCAEFCPTGSIRMVGAKHPKPYWRLSCESCMRCMCFCPQRAVEASHAWAVLLYFAITLPVSYLLASHAVDALPAGVVQAAWFRSLLEALVTVPLAGLLYYALHGISRIPWVNRVLSYSTLTYLYYRYEPPETKLADLTEKRP